MDKIVVWRASIKLERVEVTDPGIKESAYPVEREWITNEVIVSDTSPFGVLGQAAEHVGALRRRAAADLSAAVTERESLPEVQGITVSGQGGMFEVIFEPGDKLRTSTGYFQFNGLDWIPVAPIQEELPNE